MSQNLNSIKKSYNELRERNGKFIKGLSFNFDNPQILQNSSSEENEETMCGDLIIHAINYTAKYQGNYSIYSSNAEILIEIKEKSNDKKCNMSFELDDLENKTIMINNDKIIFKFEEFLELLDKGKLVLYEA